MKILIINVMCGIRSTGRICTDLADELARQGNEVKIAYGRSPVPSSYQKYAVRIGSDMDVKLHGVRARLLDASGRGSRRATVEFIKWVREYDPDIIHLHNIHGYYLNVEVLFSYLRTCGKRIIWTFHDCWAVTGHTPYCDVVNCDKWKTGCGKCPCLKFYPKSFVDRSKRNWEMKSRLFTGIPNMTIVTPSCWLADIVRQSYMRDYEIRVIHNGIDTSKFSPVISDIKEKLGIGGKFMILGVATAWDEMKGYSDYIKTAELLGDEYKVVLVGLTDAQMRSLPERVLGIKRTNSVSELAELYSASDLFLNLSYCENYPTVNLEALACGTPILTYRTGGSPEIAEAYGGIIVERGDVAAVVDAVRKLRSEMTGSSVEVPDKSSIDCVTTISEYLRLYNYPTDRRS